MPSTYISATILHLQYSVAFQISFQKSFVLVTIFLFWFGTSARFVLCIQQEGASAAEKEALPGAASG